MVSPSLLITDDDRAFRETLREVFQPRGFRTILAADGEEAVEVARSEPELHLVLIDMHMPRLTGIEAIKRIRQHRAGMPCILISGQLDDEIRSSVDAIRVLDKPVSFQEVTESVHDALRITYPWGGDLP